MFMNTATGADEAATSLQDDLLEVTEFIVPPGKSIERWVQRDPKARYVLAMGLFREPLGDAWRAATALPPVPEYLCVESPPGEKGPPGPLDEKLRFILQSYQIEPLRVAPVQAPPPLFEQPQRGAQPQGSKT